MKYLVCYSGGHSSALVAVEVVRKHGAENVILLNHDISSRVEHADIKRFKREVAEYLGLSITYANHPEYEAMTPLAVARALGTFGVRPGQTFCTMYLKTKPFRKWLRDNYPIPRGETRDDITVLYGFDAHEPERITRRSQMMGIEGYRTGFPLISPDRTILDIEEVGIQRPVTYKIYKHANCIGCLKAGKQHWYCVYCLRPDIWAEARQVEDETGHSIISDAFLADLEPRFAEMRDAKGICPTDKGNAMAFWARVNEAIPEQLAIFPCECAF